MEKEAVPDPPDVSGFDRACSEREQNGWNFPDPLP